MDTGSTSIGQWSLTISRVPTGKDYPTRATSKMAHEVIEVELENTPSAHRTRLPIS